MCCLDCPDRQQCPDKCPRTETTFCVGVIEEGEEDGADQQTGGDRCVSHLV